MKYFSIILLMVTQMSYAENLRLMTFNIWRGGDQVNLGMVVEAIRQANPDIVAIQEAEGNLRQLGELLGCYHIHPRTQIFSKYPLFDPQLNGMGCAVIGEGGFQNPYVFVELSPGKLIAVANVHLTSQSDGPEGLRDGLEVKEIIECEKKLRLSQIIPICTSLEEVHMPVFLMGDLNSPSHLDRPENWPVSLRLQNAGFKDSYRAVHPSSKETPGITWTAGYPCPRIKSNEVMNRIDFIFMKGDVKAIDSFVLGEEKIHPWPSDHRAIISDFRVNLALASPMLQVTTNGDQAQIRYTGIGNQEMTLVVGDDLVSCALDENDRSMLALTTTQWLPGLYQAKLVDEQSKVRASTTFRVMDVWAKPMVYFKNHTISWENAPANKWDWIGIYKSDSDLQDPISYFYTGSSVVGSAIIPNIEPGNYEIRLYANDSFLLLASTHICL